MLEASTTLQEIIPHTVPAVSKCKSNRSESSKIQQNIRVLW